MNMHVPALHTDLSVFFSETNFQTYLALNSFDKVYFEEHVNLSFALCII